MGVFDLEPAHPPPDPNDPRPKVPSVAILVVAHGVPHLLYQHGTDLEYWVGAYGDAETAQHMTDRLPDGVHVWEGRVRGSRDYWGEYDEELDGATRPITADEWKAFNADEYVWHADELKALAAWHERHPEGP